MNKVHTMKVTKGSWLLGEWPGIRLRVLFSSTSGSGFKLTGHGWVLCINCAMYMNFLVHSII